MSIKRVAQNSVVDANQRVGGARSSKSARRRHGEEFLAHCRLQQVILKDIKEATPELLKSWIVSMREKGDCKEATLHNKVASIRALIKARGVDLKRAGFSDSVALGLKARSRVGVKKPVTDEVFEAAIEKATTLGEHGFVHLLKLERYLGFRGLEALMSTHALAKYAKQAKFIAGQGMSEMSISDGTKCARPRDVAVIADYAQKTFEIICEALQYALQNDGFLLQGKPGTKLKGARYKYHRLAAKVGLTGEYSPHSMRYRYCVDKLQELHKTGVPRNEALILASQYLGHGDGRGRFVSMVYGRTVVHQLPKTTRKQNIRNVLAALELNAKNESLPPLVEQLIELRI